jgi:hypothetical protein
MCPFCMATMGLIVAGTVSHRWAGSISRQSISQEKTDQGKQKRTQMKGVNDDVNENG